MEWRAAVFFWKPNIMSVKTKGTIIALIGIAIWSTSGVLISYLLNNYPFSSLSLAFWRNLIISIFLFPVLVVFRRKALILEKKDHGFTLLHGGFLAVFNSIWVLSVFYNGASVATVLAYSSAGFTAILAYFIFQEKITGPKVAAIILSLGGSILVSKAYDPAMWELNTAGIIVGLTTGAFFAGYTLFGKASLQRRIDPWSSMFYTFLVGSGFIFIFNLVPTLPGASGSLMDMAPPMEAAGWFWMIFLSLGPTLMGFGFYNISMMFIPASVTNILATSEPAMTAIQAYFFLGEQLNGLQILGSLIILSAVLMLRISEK